MPSGFQKRCYAPYNLVSLERLSSVRQIFHQFCQGSRGWLPSSCHELLLCLQYRRFYPFRLTAETSSTLPSLLKTAHCTTRDCACGSILKPFLSAAAMHVIDNQRVLQFNSLVRSIHLMLILERALECPMRSRNTDCSVTTTNVAVGVLHREPGEDNRLFQIEAQYSLI